MHLSLNWMIHWIEIVQQHVILAHSEGRLRAQGPHLNHPNYHLPWHEAAGLTSLGAQVNGQSNGQPTLQKTILSVEERTMAAMAAQKDAMSNRVPKFVTQARASFLLGIPEAELGRISKESGLGQVERSGNEEETYFTYEELQRICVLAADEKQTVH